MKVNLFFSHWDIEDKLGTGLNACEKMQIAIGKGVETLPEVTHELEQLRVVTERTRGLMEEQRLECKKARNKGTKEYKQMRRGFNERIAESSKQDTIDWFKSVVTEAKEAVDSNNPRGFARCIKRIKAKGGPTQAARKMPRLSENGEGPPYESTLMELMDW